MGEDERLHRPSLRRVGVPRGGEDVRCMTLGPFLVAFAAMLWGADGLWRTGLVQSGWPSWTIVFWEHVILVAATGWLLWRDRRMLLKLDRGDWIALTIIAV